MKRRESDERKKRKEMRNSTFPDLLNPGYTQRQTMKYLEGQQIRTEEASRVKRKLDFDDSSDAIETRQYPHKNRSDELKLTGIAEDKHIQHRRFFEDVQHPRDKERPNTNPFLRFKDGVKDMPPNINNREDANIRRDSA